LGALAKLGAIADNAEWIGGVNKLQARILETIEGEQEYDRTTVLPQHLANCCWALTELGIKWRPPLFEVWRKAVLAACGCNSGSCKLLGFSGALLATSDAATILRSSAIAGNLWSDEELLRSLIGIMLRAEKSMNPQDLAAIVAAVFSFPKNAAACMVSMSRQIIDLACRRIRLLAAKDAGHLATTLRHNLSNMPRGSDGAGLHEIIRALVARSARLSDIDGYSACMVVVASTLVCRTCTVEEPARDASRDPQFLADLQRLVACAVQLAAKIQFGDVSSMVHGLCSLNLQAQLPNTLWKSLLSTAKTVESRDVVKSEHAIADMLWAYVRCLGADEASVCPSEFTEVVPIAARSEKQADKSLLKLIHWLAQEVGKLRRAGLASINALWALAKIGIHDADCLSRLCEQATKVINRLQPHTIATLMISLVTLESRRAFHLNKMQQRLAQSGLEQRTVQCGLDAQLTTKLWRFIVAHCSEQSGPDACSSAQSLSWRDIAHIDLGIRFLGLDRRTDEGDDYTPHTVRSWLLTEVSEKLHTMSSASYELNLAPSILFLDTAAGSFSGHWIVVDDRYVEKAIRRQKHKRTSVHSWRRMSVREHQGSLWPSSPTQFDHCALRLPASASGLRYALDGIVSVMKNGSTVWVYGTKEEGIHELANIVKAHLNYETRRISDVASGDVEVWMFDVTSDLDCKRGSDDWLSTTEWECPVLHTTTQNWRVYPGLFAQGGLDVMTQALLQTVASFLPCPLDGDLLLDFASGSGVIGRVLAAQYPLADVHLLEADAVAMDAAQRNCTHVASIKGYHLGDGWLALAGGDLSFDVVVSNPPVHIRRQDDFSVVQMLIDGLSSRLNKPNGQVWIVAQAYVPVGLLLEAQMLASSVMWTDGRFVVWKGVWPVARASSQGRKKRKIE
jgi:16S rRNA G1207 methylase RsmC